MTPKVRRKTLNKRSAGFTLIELIIVVIVLAAIVLGVMRACRPSASAETVTSEPPPVQANIGLRYQPPLVPIVISIGTDGLSVSIDGHVQTQIGTFSVYGNVVVPVVTDAPKTLTVVLGRRGYVYALDKRRFEVELPNDISGKSKLAYDGKGNIRVDIPNPVLQRRDIER